MSQHIFKSGTFTEATTFPLNVWVPANGYKVNVRQLHLVIANRTTGQLQIAIRLRSGGSMQRMAVVACGSNGNQSFTMPIPVDFFTDTGDGSVAVVDLEKISTTTSNNFIGFGSIIGEEV